jgi:hypothetical protein
VHGSLSTAAWLRDSIASADCDGDRGNTEQQSNSFEIHDASLSRFRVGSDTKWSSRRRGKIRAAEGKVRIPESTVEPPRRRGEPD